ncbi:MAG: hypothetical protein KAV99_07025 [Candidatus Latescibacteria bacterium]|nr:hypothetical protein [Candidatus Latescibacterota bacterium]
MAVNIRNLLLLALLNRSCKMRWAVQGKRNLIGLGLAAVMLFLFFGCSTDVRYNDGRVYLKNSTYTIHSHQETYTFLAWLEGETKCLIAEGETVELTEECGPLAGGSEVLVQCEWHGHGNTEYEEFRFTIDGTVVVEAYGVNPEDAYGYEIRLHIISRDW